MEINRLNRALYQFKRAKRVLKEDYGMAPNDDYEMMGDMEQEIPMERGQVDISHYRGGKPREGEQGEEMDMNLSKSDERIAQIREIALEGLQDYAQDVDCEAYQFYKKIWLMCDKAVSEKDSASNGAVS